MVRSYCAPAKINLTLEVLSRRDDGYHGIRSAMVPLQLSDQLSVEAADAFAFECTVAELAGDGNLAVRALTALGPLPPVRLRLDKRIPFAAGLGGGSSDAAAVLRAAMEGAFGPAPVADWLDVARRLGSDVPFFLAGTGALVEGTGERVTPLGALAPWCVLLVKPPSGVTTAWAYDAIDRQPPAQRPRAGSVSLAMIEALQAADFEAVTALLHNDFQPVVAEAVPEVARALEALRRAGSERPLLAGSGSCVFALAKDRSSLEAMAARLDLPAEFARWTTGFAQTPDWRP